MQIGNKGSKCFKNDVVIKAIRSFKNEVLAFGIKLNSTLLNFPYIPSLSIFVSPPTILKNPIMKRL